MNIDGPSFVPTHPNNVELERLGDEIAELATHLDAATARLLDLIRSSTLEAAGAMAFARALTGSLGVSAWSSALPASMFASRARSAHCRG